MSSGNSIVVVSPGGGRNVPRRFGETTVVKVAEDETEGAYALRENSAPAGYASVPFHIHHTAEEAFFVLEGEMTVHEESREHVAPAGSFVLIPRGLVHSFANRGATPVRWLTLISPAWVSGWIDAEAELMASNDRPNDEAQAAIYEKYGLELVGPPPAE